MLKIVQSHYTCMYELLTKGVVTLGNLSCNLSRNFIAPLQHKLHTSLPSVTCPECNVFVAVTVARSRTDFYFLQRLRDMFISWYVTLGNDSCNLSCNKIAKQATKKIAW